MTDGKINILLVDDKPEKLLALEAVLEDLHANVVRAYSGRDALRCLLNQEFAVVLLDVNMPGMDGFETASLIRQRKSTEDVPIIFVTAFGDEDHQARGYSLGAVDYIQTPIVPDVLRTKVSVFVDLFKKTEQVRRQAESLRQRATQRHKLTEACLSINSALSIDRILSVVADTARDVLGAHRASTTFVRDNNWVHASTAHSASEKYSKWRQQPPSAEPDEIFGLVCSTNKLIRLTPQELEEHPMWHRGDGQPDHRPPMRGWLAAPLTDRDGHNIGLIEISDKSDGDFNSDDEAILTQISQMASIAIINCIFAEERETNRMKDEFLSTLSHELRTPLNAILGWTQLLQLEHNEGDIAHGLEVIERNAKAQAKLVDDMLDVSRVTTGKLRINLRPIDLTSIVEAALDAIRPTAEMKSVAVSFSNSAAEAMTLGDSDRLPQVVWNLLTNAIKFTPPQGRIEVLLDRMNNHLRLRISDTGQGIQPAFLPYVFDRFRQGDSTSTRSHGGLGIGLTIVRHIVELHGGSVHAESPGENHGATFTVLLPIIHQPALSSSAKPATAAPNAAETPQIDLHGISVLVVDDEADTREVIASLLTRAGAEVRAVPGVADAMNALAESIPHVVLSDIAMPHKDGYDFIRMMRDAPPPTRSIPAIAMTAYAREEDRARALSTGYQLHLPKPIIPIELLLGVHHLAQQHPRPENGAAKKDSLEVKSSS